MEGFFGLLLFLLIGFGIYKLVSPFLKKLEEEQRQRDELEAARQRQIVSACNESILAFENIPKDLMTAEQLLDTAETEFQDGAFSPFWDSIERSMRNIGAVDDSLKLIAERSSQYKELIKSYNGVPPPFPVDPASAHRLKTAATTAARLQTVVRKAQRNFQFATIYEQRKTSAILIAGFGSLGEAIYGLGARLEQSIGILGDQINDLSSSMDAMNENVVDAVKGVSSAVGDVSSRVDGVSAAIKSADTNTQAAMSELGSRQDKANKMLDNIQRGRRPAPLADH